MLSNFRLVDWASHGDIIRTYAMHVSLKKKIEYALLDYPIRPQGITLSERLV